MSRPEERGAALLLVVLLVALLSVLVVEFQREARVEVRAAQNLADDLQAQALLRSGAELTDQVLAIYAKNSLGDMKAAREQIKGTELLWQFLFYGDTIAVPVPSAALTMDATLRAQLSDLYGRFPLGPLLGEGNAPYRAAFKDYLGYVKEFLAQRGEGPLDAVGTDGLADALFERLDAEGAVKRLADLGEVEGFTPAVRRALEPFLDARAEWKFNANSRCVPLILTMGDKTTIEEARELAGELRDDPIDAEADIPNRLGSLRPEFQGSLTTKSARFQAIFEASVRGGARRARAIFARKLDDTGAAEGRFGTVEWVQGWVEGLEEPPAEAADESRPGGEAP